MQSLLTILILGMWNVFVHPIHLTLSEVVYEEKSKSIQVTHKIFMDDLERHVEESLKAKGKEVNLKLGTPQENPDTDRYLAEYLAAHFKLLINGKAYKANFLGKEYEDVACWLYVEIPNVPKPKSIDLTDSFLMDLYDDQSNLVNFTFPQKKGSMRFIQGKVRESFSIQ
jgi:hypothetical protein